MFALPEKTSLLQLLCPLRRNWLDNRTEWIDVQKGKQADPKQIPGHTKFHIRRM